MLSDFGKLQDAVLKRAGIDYQAEIDAMVEAQNLKALIDRIWRGQGMAFGSALWVVGRYFGK